MVSMICAHCYSNVIGSFIRQCVSTFMRWEKKWAHAAKYVL